jgi:hypothetical protein
MRTLGLLAVLVAVGLAGCTAPAPSPVATPDTPAPVTGTAEGGITGKVSVYACPAPCTSPGPITVRISMTGELDRVVRTGSDGTYRVALPPGRYVVSVGGDPIDPRMSKPVVVPPAGYVTADLELYPRVD